MSKIRKILFLFILLIICSIITELIGQTVVIDSLENLIRQHTKKDTTRVNLLNETSNKLFRVDNGKALKYAEEAGGLADKLNFKKGKIESLRLEGIYYIYKSDFSKVIDCFQQSLEIAEEIGDKKSISTSYFYFGIVHYYQSNYSKAIENYEKSLKIDKERGDKQGVSKCLNNIGSIYKSQGKYSQALEYFQKSFEINKELDDKHEISYSLNNLGIINQRIGNYDIAISYFQKSLKIKGKLDDKMGISNCLNNIGKLYSERSNYPLALDYFHKTLIIKEEIEDKRGVSICLSNIGIIYFYQKNFNEALKYYKKASIIDEELDNKQGVSRQFNHIGLIYNKQGKYIEARDYYYKSLVLCEELNDLNGISYVLNNLGEVYYNLEDYYKALKYFQKSVKIKNEIGDKLGICVSYKGIGAIYIEQNNFVSALDFTLKSLQIANDLKLLDYKKDIYEQLSEIYANTKDFKKAYENHVLYKKLNDSIFNEENIKKITGLEYKYEYEKEKQAMELEQQKKDAVLAEEAKQQKTVRNLFITGFILMFMLVLVVLRSFLHKRKANHILAEQKQKIEESNKELSQQKEEIQTQAEELSTTNKKLIQQAQFKDDLTNMIVHDLKTPLSTIISIDIISNVERMKEIVKLSGFKMLNLVQNILDIYKYDEVEFKLDKTNNNLNELIETAIVEMEFLAKQKSLNFKNNEINKLFVFVDKEIVKRILVNLFSNAVKFSPLNGIISISGKFLDNKKVRISIHNQGFGIPKDKQKMIFQRFGQAEQKGLGELRSTGLGLTFCKMAIEAHGGEIGVISESEIGAEFWFTLPVGNQKDKENIIKNEIIEKNPFELSPTDKEILKPFLPKFQEQEIYRITDIKGILKQIDFTKTRNLQNWKKEMDNALYALNQEKYSTLVSLID